PALAESTDPISSERAILVLDASGSMWGQIDGTPKIAIARDVIQGLLGDWSSKVELGLTAYGHREKGNCADIETLAPVGPVNAQSMMAAIEGLNPKGKTPLTAAVRQAAETLKYTEEKATVILVSDGEETCDLDPCEIGRVLENTGVDFTAHIISFDVPEEDTAGLRCLASETGGVFLEARNANELKDAMSEANEIIADESPIDLGEATLSVPEQVIAGSVFEAEWSGPQNRSDSLGIFGPDGKKSFGYTYIGDEEEVSPSGMTAPDGPGTYWVRYVTARKDVLAEAALTVIPAKASISAPDSVLAGSVFELEWQGPQNSHDRVIIVSADGEQSFANKYIEKEGALVTLEAPDQPGPYEVRYITRQNNTLAHDAFEVAAAEASISAPDSVLAGSVFELEWHGPQNSHDRVIILSADGEQSYANKYIEKEGALVTLEAPDQPGPYEVRYITRQNNTLAHDAFEVAAAEASISAPDSVLAGSVFELEWRGPQNSHDRVIIVSADGEQSYANKYIEKEGALVTLEAPDQPGPYEVRYITRYGNTLAKQIIGVR
ncbi:MAG: vWA domain-containing protein, partial [Geminicoccaceae bacterium]